jgi:CRISPR-associated protein Csc1
MHIYRLCLTLQDPLYFATRELGRLYVTEHYLHNYALTYALGFAKSSYHDMEHIPHYEEDIAPLNQQKNSIYVTPAKAIDFNYVTHTYKWANLNYHVEMEQISKNIPTYGRIRELAPESSFEFFILAKNPLQRIPKWIRLGKWMSKADLKITQELNISAPKNGDFTVYHPLNPLDVMFSHQVLSYDTVNMPPVSLIRNVSINGHFYDVDGFKIPARMEYRFKV